MINIIDVVKEIISEDDVATEALSTGIINFSNYARSIHKEVEKRTYKNVNIQSIVVALSRIGKNTKNTEKHNLKITSLSVHSDLEDITFDKTQDNLNNLKNLYLGIPVNYNGYFSSSVGVNEVTIIGDSEVMKKVLEIYNNSRPISHFRQLTGITVKFSTNYLSVPNVLFKIFAKIAAKSINVIEVVSTLTEITFIVNKPDTDLSISQLSKLL